MADLTTRDYLCAEECPKNLVGVCCRARQVYLASEVHRSYVVAPADQVRDEYPGPGWLPVFDRESFVGWVGERSLSPQECRVATGRLARRGRQERMAAT